MVKEYKNNRSLQRYENKAPDFDYLERESNTKTKVGRYILQDDGTWVNPNQKQTNEATLFFLGDLLCQESQMFEAETKDGFDFNYAFELVSPILKQSDLTIGNLETPVCDCAPYRSERYTSEQAYYNNAPSAYLEAVADAGIDLVSTANNHNLDAGVVGLGATIDHCRELGLIQTGTFKDDSKHYQMVIVNGIKIAFIAFAKYHNFLAGNFSLEGRKKLFITYDSSKAEDLYKQAKDDGAQLVVALMHWGTEYKKVPKSNQKEIASFLAETGYDLIVGSHPHIVQYYEETITGDSRKVPVIYSLGNFISHQKKEGSYLSVIFKTLVSINNDSSVNIKCSYIPCCTANTLFNKKYVVLPLCEDIGNLLSNDDLNNYLQYIATQVGENLVCDNSIKLEKPNNNSLNWKNSTHIEEKTPSTRAYNAEIKKVIEKDFPDAIKYKSYWLKDEGDSWQLLGLSKTGSSFEIPRKIDNKTIKTIRSCAFAGNKAIKKINFPSFVNVLNESVCEGCTNLEGFILSKHLKTIKKKAFYNCISLTSVVIRLKVEKIEELAFAGCVNLRSIKIPKNVKFIDKSAFQDCPDVIIYGLKDSYAEKYAKKNKIPFRVLRDIDNLIPKKE